MTNLLKRSDALLNIWDAIKKLTESVSNLEKRVDRLEDENLPQERWHDRP